MAGESMEVGVAGFSYADALAGGSRPLTDPSNPVVFLDVSVGSHAMGRIKIELFKHLMPKCAENFRQFCTGEHKMNSVPVGYKNVKFHRVLKGFMIHGGDFVKGDGTGSLSIYGSSFPLEAPPPPEAIQGLTGSAATAAAAKAIAAGSVPHFRAGLLCMANSAASSSKQQQQPQDPKQQQQRSGTNGCQFFITCGSCLWLDGRNDVFGQVIGRDSYQVLRKIEHVSTDAQGMPKVDITITECGEL
ncbi:peptidyl-prolyl cis-trans isomerase H, putative [Eimeria tenella]|uniref:Peptidyl-prolyl cis-trans isomerase n=1 Tax=Eimeria tenella TaxID=5802 RepID=U6KTN8_EIMTE|nr:peptidyl-prolyl cis-trans isomerase H, putative [Eimeria tenella]CDJ40298.1 peptidyl-prolyl cis-trans isomerase H, putative [Eimeria tenella]|eukprot:XP_013231051.1 peptidyl-prolyl cis-trans isomerase H, putative [Eimeria tenella]